MRFKMTQYNDLPDDAKKKLEELSREYSSIPQLQGWASRKESAREVTIETTRHKEISIEMWQIFDLYEDKEVSPPSFSSAALKKNQKAAVARAIKQLENNS
jgi:hypothetical protein